MQQPRHNGGKSLSLLTTMTILSGPVTLIFIVLSAGTPAETADVQNRLNLLEAESAQLRVDIQAYKNEIQRLPPVETQPASNPTITAISSINTNASAVQSSPSEFTDEELQGVMQKLAWTTGPFKITPYGRLWTSMSYDTQRTQVGSYVLWIDSPDVRTGKEFQLDARSTRFGTDIAGPAVALFDDAKLGGKVEFDFQGPSLQDNNGGILFRHGYLEIKNEDYRLLAGQTWDVISPLYTPTFDYTVGSGAGNLAYRRAQFRMERYLPHSDTSMITLQTAIAVEILVPVASVNRIQSDHSSWPDWQNRVAVTFGERKAKDAHPVEIGFSGHVGEQQFNVFPLVGPPLLNVKRPSWSFSVDAKIPFNTKCGIQGELFTGENLSNYYGGILQGVDPNTLKPIRDNGGWADIWYDMRPDLHWNLGYSIDDPLNKDMTTGRTYNQYLYANFVYDITKFLNAGLEVSSWKTFYYNQRPGEAIRLEAVTRYNF
jgi:hypothetical protein